MRTDLVFNELSLTPLVATNLAAQGAMDNFIATIKACRTVGIGGTFRIPEGFHASALAPDYPIARWLNDQTVSKEKKLFIGALAIKTPYLGGLLGTSDANGFDEAEFQFDGSQADGLGVAYILDAVGISLSVSPPWHEPLVTITQLILNEVTGQVDDNKVSVRHVSRPDHVGAQGRELRQAEDAAVVSGTSLWNACPQLFSKLRFCASVEPQVRALTWGVGGLAVVFRTFRELHAVCENWLEGTFDSTGIPNTTREGPATLQQFAEERTFMTPDGIAEVFSWHVKRGSIRIHFVPDAEAKTCLVGYVGPHLRTVKNKN